MPGHLSFAMPGIGRTFVGGFESTYLPGAGVDLVELTGHAARWREDLDRMLAAGVRHLRYPLRWQRIEREPGRYDWAETDAVLGGLRDAGAVPIVDLVHHTTYPDWIANGFRDPGFGPAYVRYATAVAERYPWLPAYTLFNEPFATLFLAGHAGLWPPYDRGTAGFVRLLRSVLPAIGEAAAIWSELLPEAAHVWVDTAEHHRGEGSQETFAALANDRRHVALDLLLGHDLDPGRPYLRELLAAGGEPLLDLPRIRVDLLGLDYYCHSEWWYDAHGARSPSPHPVGPAEICGQYFDRYGRPMMLTETNIRGLPSDQASWLRYTLEQYELALSRGVPLHGYCWFPLVDSTDWDSLLARGAGRVDPVGVHALGPGGERRRTTFTAAWEAAAAGAPVADLPAYRFQHPCADQLADVLPGLAHWPWQDPPAADLVRPAPVPGPPTPVPEKESPVAEPDLVVLSHLRWPWVWQRPQHLVSRLARRRAGGGARTWFVEEPVSGPVTEAVVQTEQLADVTRAWLVVPEAPGRAHLLGFDDPAAAGYGELLAAELAAAGRPPAPDVWVYTPMAGDIARALDPGRLAYDVMDDLSAFADAPVGLRLAQQRLLAEADVVFAGGRSLHRSVAGRCRGVVHLFPSGVDTAHYAASRQLRRPRERLVAGYVGVVDERLDLELLGELARLLPDWTIRVVGPVTKIDEADLPAAPNLEYAGFTPYERLPEVMAGFDVALMPFALNEATRSISPTKTLEYLAAGLPVVSTRVPDVIADYPDVVHFADDGAGFGRACREVVRDGLAERDRRLAPIRDRQEWNSIAASMAALLERAGRGSAIDTYSDTDTEQEAAG
jgi:beta-glucosidase/6-phospho-beta-glucosidase/beta-galactosidase